MSIAMRSGPLLLVLHSAVGAAATLHVPAEFSTIQQALDAAKSGDEVVVAPGTYQENLQVVEKNLTLRSVAGPATTIIDGGLNESVLVIEGGDPGGVVVSGFTFTNGLSSQMRAGGISVVGGGPFIAGNRVVSNWGEFCSGNGISLFGSEAVLYRNVISDNHNDPNGAQGGGGGGGLSVNGNPCRGVGCKIVIRDNVIENNTSARCSSGGGVLANAAGEIEFVGNRILGNSAQFGGGIALQNGSRALIENNLFVRNSASSTGGAVNFLGRNPLRIVGNTFVENDGVDGTSLHLLGATKESVVANNMLLAIGSAGAIACQDGSPRFQNNNVFAPAGQSYSGSCTGQTGMSGNISTSPTFLDADYALAPGSAGIDAGENAVATQDNDILGRARIADGNDDGKLIVDMGAFEYGDTIYDDSFEWDLPLRVLASFFRPSPDR